ncbi:MAG: hypothetical protein ACKVHR_15590 [Pirellulales bacterium]
MSCVCKQQLNAALAGLKNLPLAALAGLLPPGIPTLPALMIGQKLSASAQATASLSAEAKLLASLAANASLSANLSISQVAKLEALANLSNSLGINVFSPKASLQISLAIQSANLHLPSFAALLAELLAPLIEMLAEIAQMLASMATFNTTLGLNLAMPGVAPKISAAVNARLALAAKLGVNAGVNASAAANLSAHMRLAVACKALGINLLGPSGLPQLNAALKLAAKLKVPPLSLGMSQLSALIGALAQLAAIQSMLKVNLRLPNAMQLLAAALKPLLESMNAIASLKINANAAAAVAANFAASESVAANFAASASATASASLSGLLLPPIPQFPQLTMLANFSNQFSLGSGIISSSPCSGCAFGIR